jgi:hypothetical protein
VELVALDEDAQAVAIVPQLVVVHAFAKAHNGFVESLTSDYVFCLGGYRAMYLVNWIYRLATEPGYTNWIVWVSGIIQTGIYCDFFYYYVKRYALGLCLLLRYLSCAFLSLPSDRCKHYLSSTFIAQPHGWQERCAARVMSAHHV